MTRRAATGPEAARTDGEIGGLAGLLGRTNPPATRDIDRLRDALGGNAQTHVDGPLALAFTGAAGAASHDERLCVTVGRFYSGPEEGSGRPADPAAAVLSTWCPALDPPAWLRGEFGLLLWDRSHHRGLLACDQMGQRALFWHDDGAVLRFATEVRELLAMLPRRPPPEVRAMAHWITVSGVPQDLTLYEGIRRLGAAQSLELDARRRVDRPRRWWPPRHEEVLDIGAQEAAALLRRRLDTAVRRRTAGSDVTAIQLSGGLDSSSVAGMAAALGPGLAPARSYSATFPDHPSIDESELITALARHLSIKSTRAAVRSGSVLAGALPHLEHWRIPPVSPNLFFWRPMVEQAASDGVSVLLDGEGGDDLFGLAPYLVADMLKRGRVRAAYDLRLRVPGATSLLTRRQARQWLMKFGIGALAPAALHVASRRVRNPRSYVPEWIRPDVARAFVSVADGAEWKRFDGPHWRRWLLWATSSGLGPALLYDHVRHRALMAGIEPRHPLVDVDVVELILRLPPELAFDRAYSRPLLRMAVAGLIPEEVRLRPGKSAFDEIFHASLAGPDLPVARHFLGRSARVGEYVDLRMISERLLDGEPPTDRSARRDWAIHVWRLLTGECFLRAQEDPAGPRRTAEEIGLPEPVVDLERASTVAG